MMPAHDQTTASKTAKIPFVVHQNYCKGQMHASNASTQGALTSQPRTEL